MPIPTASRAAPTTHLTWVQTGGWSLRDADDGVLALLGFAPAEFLAGRVTLQERIHPDDQDIADMLFAPDPAPTSGTANLRLRRANGRIVCVRCTHEKTQAPNGELTLRLALQDAKHLARTLDDASATANFRAMMENTDDFIYFKDRNHVFTGASQTLVNICDPAEHWTDLLGLTDYDVFPEAYADTYYRLEKQVFQGLPVAQEIQETLDKLGHRGWVDNRKYPIHNAHGDTIGLFGIARDITERRQAEQKLLVSEAQQRNLMQNIKVGVVVHAPDTTLLQANEEATRLLGLSLAQMQGKVAIDPAWCFVDEAGTPLPPSAYPVTQVLASNKPLENFTAGIRHPGGGGLVWVLVNAYCELDEHQVPQRVVVTFADITQHQQAQEQLSLAARVFTSAHEGIVITDANGAIVDVNETFTQITGYSRDEVLGKNPRILQSGQHSPAFYAQMWAEVSTQGHWSGEVWNRRKNGEVYPEMLTISAVRRSPDDDSVTRHYVALFSDITAIKAHQSELERIAHFDTLTGLPNRLLLGDRLNRALSQSQRRQQSVAVVYLDLDNIKAINDSHGHEAGDAVLVAVSGYMQKALREGDTLARIGGDEFVVVLVDLNEATDCIPVLQRLLRAAATPVTLNTHTDMPEQSVYVSASIGVTFYPQDNVDADVLMRHADQAMYLAKQAGKNRYHLFDVAQDAAIHSRHEELLRIGQALEHCEFVLHYQPKVNMRTGQVTGAEALVRWQHPAQGLLPPAAFLPAMEEHAVSVELGEWVIATALAQMSAWRSQGLDLAVSVNIGALQLQQTDFPQRLAHILAAHPEVPPQRLQLEILETSALEDTAKVTAVIETCRAMQVAFALDDFGTGYSSLTYLKKLHADILKIDQSFVLGMTDNPDDLAIVKGVIGLADVFHREVIAEGVETHAHGKLLMAIGCDLAQGYGIARPMPAKDMPTWVKKWHAEPTWKVDARG
jgi:diguanylate cyclase (GGDEF)-like protein/PAS domain S-box-containing protein